MDIRNKITELGKLLKIEEKRVLALELKKRLGEPNIWKDEGGAGEITSELSSLEKVIKEWQDLDEISQLANEQEILELEPKIAELERRLLYGGKYDNNSAILQIYSGAGGVDAQDWAQMLLTMYSRYCQIHNYQLDLVDKTAGQEAGIKNATLLICGDFAYGNLKSEHGVHRLVRLSPFNSKNLRQTSFALVEVIPEVKVDTNIKIDDKDIKIDVFRSSGHGGQSVNTTDSAVRVTHIPTGLVVTCQNQRSQLQNKETALRILTSRLLDLAQRQHKDDISELRGESINNEWGSQIRSYVIHPYKLVKDHRTGFESTNPDAVLAGGLDGFVEAYLKFEAGNK